MIALLAPLCLFHLWVLNVTPFSTSRWPEIPEENRALHTKILSSRTTYRISTPQKRLASLNRVKYVVVTLQTQIQRCVCFRSVSWQAKLTRALINVEADGSMWLTQAASLGKAVRPKTKLLGMSYLGKKLPFLWRWGANWIQGFSVCDQFETLFAWQTAAKQMIRSWN